MIAVSVIAVVVLVACSLLVVVGAGGASQASATPSAVPSDSLSASPSDSPTLVPSPSSAFDGTPTPMPTGWSYADLDGVAAADNFAHRLPVAIMIADNAVSRPQSGISSASIVYQAYADGGEDRYMFVFQEGTASDIGPVRSARPYYVYWAAEYEPLYGHVGGDAHSLRGVIPEMAKYIYNMDELNGGTCGYAWPYRRITSRAAPQNDYTTSNDLITCAAKKGYPATYQSLPTRPFREDVPQADRPSSQEISIPYRTGTIGYQYDPATDMYLRIVDGQPEVDPANSNQVYARNIVVMYQAVGFDPGSMDETNRPWVTNVGRGDATLFIEGKVIAARWEKTSKTALTRFYDKSSGAEIPFVRGAIFMQSVPPGTAVTVK